MTTIRNVALPSCTVTGIRYHGRGKGTRRNWLRAVGGGSLEVTPDITRLTPDREHRATIEVYSQGAYLKIPVSVTVGDGT